MGLLASLSSCFTSLCQITAVDYDCLAGYVVEYVRRQQCNDARDIAASISSGSFKTAGMVILPCSIKTLSGIVNSYTDTLVTRAADVVLKERRPLVLCVRETPLHLGHLRLMTQAAELGAVIMPPVPAFYHRPQSLDDVINQTVNRELDQFDIDLPEDLFTRWQGA